MALFPEYIDTHSHLHHPDRGDEWEQVIPRALEEGTWMILVGQDYASSSRAIEIAREFPYGVYAAIGIHPAHLDQSEISPFNFGMDAFRELAAHPKVVAIGEVGFDTRQVRNDLHEEQVIHRQEEVLRQFAALAESRRLPLVLHAHGANDELLRFLSWFREEGGGLHLRGILHHFTGKPELAERFRALDVLPTFTGLMARSHIGNGLIRSVPQNDLLIESECPRLILDPAATPRPLPAHLPGAIGYVAALRGEAPHATRSIVTKNALRVFSKIFRSLS